MTRTRTLTGTGSWTTGATTIALCTSCSRAKNRPGCGRKINKATLSNKTTSSLPILLQNASCFIRQPGVHFLCVQVKAILLRKYDHAIYIFFLIFLYFSYIFAQNIDCGFTLEPPRRERMLIFVQSLCALSHIGFIRGKEHNLYDVCNVKLQVCAKKCFCPVAGTHPEKLVQFPLWLIAENMFSLQKTKNINRHYLLETYSNYLIH